MILMAGKEPVREVFKRMAEVFVRIRDTNGEILVLENVVDTSGTNIDRLYRGELINYEICELGQNAYMEYAITISLKNSHRWTFDYQNNSISEDELIYKHFCLRVSELGSVFNTNDTNFFTTIPHPIMGGVEKRSTVFSKIPTPFGVKDSIKKLKVVYPW